MRRIPGPVWAFAAAKIVLHVATTRLGFHRDEYYFISASKRLAASYVDFQPITPLLTRLVRVFTESVLGLRLVPAIAGACVIVLSAVLARELGGDRRAMSVAAFGGFIIPLFVGANSALNTVTLEMPAWLVIAILFARIERTGDTRLWLAVGGAIGVALLVKFTVLGYLVGVPIAVLATPLRRHLRSGWLWAGAAMALLLIAPSLVWQFSHDLPVVDFVSHQSGGGKVLGLSGRLGFLASLVIFPGPFGLFFLIPGLRWLWRHHEHRAVAIITFAPLIVFLIASGKGYYASPALAVAFAAGAIGLAGRWPRLPRLLIAALVVNLLVALPLLVPLVPVSVLASSEDIAQGTEMGERLGWQDLTREVVRVLGTLDAKERSNAIVIGDNYAIPAVLEFHAPKEVPIAVSGHNSSYLWWPAIPRDHVAVVVGFDRRTVDHLYRDVERVGTVDNREHVHNYEYGKPIWVARDPKVSPSRLREILRTFEA